MYKEIIVRGHKVFSLENIYSKIGFNFCELLSLEYFLRSKFK